jgi:hypothetical protein
MYGKERNTFRVLVENLEGERDHFEDLGTDGRIISK